MSRLKVFSVLHKLLSAWEATETATQTAEGEHVVHSPVHRTSQVLPTLETQSPETGIHLEEPV